MAGSNVGLLLIVGGVWVSSWAKLFVIAACCVGEIKKVSKVDISKICESFVGFLFLKFFFLKELGTFACCASQRNFV
jgi:hypothetical protein